MIDPRRIIMVAALLGAVGIWLLLPRGRVRGRLLGIALGAVSLGLLASQMPGLGDWLAQSVFVVLAAVTIAAAAAAITLRNPVYAAISFGMSLLGIAGLLLFQGAQFLAVATIVVYAGAILVIFLFLLMLAEPEGRAPYDRLTWEGLVSAFAGAFTAGILTMTVTGSGLAGVEALLSRIREFEAILLAWLAQQPAPGDATIPIVPGQLRKEV